MATKTSQRVFIWVIAIVMTVGTVAGFIAMMIAPGNQKIDQERIATLTTDYQEAYDTYQKKVNTQTKELSNEHYKTLQSYVSVPATFASKDIKKLTKNDLKMGTGPVVDKDSQYAVYYLGWNPKGKMFDSSFSDSQKSLTRPLIRESEGNWIFPEQTGAVIEGWEEGLIGMKIGGVRELTIPADKAYKELGSGEDIPPNTPLKFIIMVISKPKDIGAQPQMPAELMRYYQSLYGQ